ncbi:uncharacterized protein C8Q71DRAFT_728298 [Rhodofomes roseus]|uniref:DUF6533 domain-containing protein n=1 Tax=Rhodofomes roseus TaxID=34475 RepID=A0ABQ8JXX3_9APHY|nr:uncharacterized protein C8Q71DRAFT_728298 [Rhodofomes roseus]KAH9829090.1 hypothetical protein C8Q71DRAFT_728298 [Rhodofomes roseus]
MSRALATVQRSEVSCKVRVPLSTYTQLQYDPRIAFGNARSVRPILMAVPKRLSTWRPTTERSDAPQKSAPVVLETALARYDPECTVAECTDMHLEGQKAGKTPGAGTYLLPAPPRDAPHDYYPMSSGALADADVVLKAGFISNCSLIAACAIYAYDRCLTLWREVNLIWTRKKMSVATGLYFLMHVSLVFFLAFEVAYTTIKTCDRLWVVYVWRVTCAMLFHVFYGAFTALRAYAIGYRSLLLGWATFLWSLVVVATEIYELIVSVPVNVPQPIGCVITTRGNEKFLSSLFLAGQATAIIPEILVIGAIWCHAYRAASVKHLHQLAGLNTPFTTILIRDGSVYFVASLAIIVLNVVWSSVTSVNTGILAPIVYSLQTILISQFYLNLHDAHAYHSETPELSDLHFNTRLLGTLAGSLTYNEKDGFVLAASDDDSDLRWDSRLDGGKDSNVEMSVMEKGNPTDRSRSRSTTWGSSVGSHTFADDISEIKVD